MKEIENCKKLWASVLQRAINDLNDENHCQSARHWLTRKKETGVGSFLWICNALELDPQAIKQGIFSNLKN